MRTVLPAPGFERPAETVGEALVPGLFPWTIRLAGPQSAWPALEVYEAGTLLDVISSTRLLVSLLRGARAGDGTAGPCALAWGRLIAPDAGLSAEFSRGRLRPTSGRRGDPDGRMVLAGGRGRHVRLGHRQVRRPHHPRTAAQAAAMTSLSVAQSTGAQSTGAQSTGAQSTGAATPAPRLARPPQTRQVQTRQVQTRQVQTRQPPLNRLAPADGDRAGPRWSRSAWPAAALACCRGWSTWRLACRQGQSPGTGPLPGPAWTRWRRPA